MQKVTGIEDFQIVEVSDSNQKIIPVDESDTKKIGYKFPAARKPMKSISEDMFKPELKSFSEDMFE